MRLTKYREQARLSISALARRADVDDKTVKRAERGEPVQRMKAIAIAQALSEALNRNIDLVDIEGLNIYQ
ncbi:MAG: helix-turn-helix domain-containing protein [Flavisolibacter sp.]